MAPVIAFPFSLGRLPMVSRQGLLEKQAEAGPLWRGGHLGTNLLQEKRCSGYFYLVASCVGVDCMLQAPATRWPSPSQVLNMPNIATCKVNWL